MNIGGPPSKINKVKYSIVNQYCERKLKENPQGSEKVIEIKYKKALKFLNKNKVPFV